MNYVQYFIDAVALGSLYALVALGIGLIFGVMRLVNLAHGELLMAGGYALFATNGWSAFIRVPLVVLVVVTLALLMERLAFRPLRDASPATMLVSLSIQIETVFPAINFPACQMSLAWSSILRAVKTIAISRAATIKTTTVAAISE